MTIMKSKPLIPISPSKSPTETPVNMDLKPYFSSTIDIIPPTRNNKTLISFNSTNTSAMKKAMEENFQQLVLQVAQSTHPNAPLTPSAVTVIKNRTNQFFSEYRTPDHPPYSAMIEIAILGLNEKGGSSENSISDFLRTKYSDLPWAHTTLLKHHLGKLCETGEIVLTDEDKYKYGGAEKEPSTSTRTRKRKRKRKGGWEREINRKRKKIQKRGFEEVNGKDMVGEKLEELQFTESNKVDIGEDTERLDYSCTDEAKDDTLPEIDISPKGLPDSEFVRVENLSHRGFGFKEDSSCLQEHGTAIRDVQNKSMNEIENESTLIEEATELFNSSKMKSRKGKKKLISSISKRRKCRGTEKMDKAVVNSEQNGKQEEMPDCSPLPTERKEPTTSKELSGSDCTVSQSMRWTKHAPDFECLKLESPLGQKTELYSTRIMDLQRQPVERTSELSMPDILSSTKCEVIKKYNRRKKMKTMEALTSNNDLLLEPKSTKDSQPVSSDFEILSVLSKHPHGKTSMHKLHQVIIGGSEQVDGKGVNFQSGEKEEETPRPRRRSSRAKYNVNYVDGLRNRPIKTNLDKEVSPETASPMGDETPRPVEARKRKGRPPKRKHDANFEETFGNLNEGIVDSVGDDEKKLKKDKIKKLPLGRPPKYRME